MLILSGKEVILSQGAIRALLEQQLLMREAHLDDVAQTLATRSPLPCEQHEHGDQKPLQNTLETSKKLQKGVLYPYYRHDEFRLLRMFDEVEIHAVTEVKPTAITLVWRVSYPA